MRHYLSMQLADGKPLRFIGEGPGREIGKVIAMFKRSGYGVVKHARWEEMGGANWRVTCALCGVSDSVDAEIDGAAWAEAHTCGGSDAQTS